MFLLAAALSAILCTVTYYGAKAMLLSINSIFGLGPALYLGIAQVAAAFAIYGLLRTGVLDSRLRTVLATWELGSLGARRGDYVFPIVSILVVILGALAFGLLDAPPPAPVLGLLALAVLSSIFDRPLLSETWPPPLQLFSWEDDGSHGVARGTGTEHEFSWSYRSEGAQPVHSIEKLRLEVDHGTLPRVRALSRPASLDSLLQRLGDGTSAEVEQCASLLGQAASDLELRPLEAANYVISFCADTGNLRDPDPQRALTERSAQRFPLEILCEGAWHPYQRAVLAVTFLELLGFEPLLLRFGTQDETATAIAIPLPLDLPGRFFEFRGRLHAWADLRWGPDASFGERPTTDGHAVGPLTILQARLDPLAP